MDQLLLNIHPVPKKTMGNFIVGKNAECLNSIERLINSTDHFFIYIWGESGSGKSHLASALREKNVKVVEDVENFDNDQQIELFNLFNKSKKLHTKLVITGNDAPNKMNLRPDLASRLSWELVYQIKPLTDDEKKVALEYYAMQKGMSFDRKIISYCMANLKRDLPSLISTLDALDEWSLKAKRPITIPLLIQLLKKDND